MPVRVDRPTAPPAVRPAGGHDIVGVGAERCGLAAGDRDADAGAIVEFVVIVVIVIVVVVVEVVVVEVEVEVEVEVVVRLLL